jgi:hypothetical protein
LGYSLTHIWIGSRKVGLIGLDQVFAEVRTLGLSDFPALTAKIIKRLSKSNYIPAEAEAEYGRALLAAYRRFLGEDVPDDQGVLEVRVYGGD